METPATTPAPPMIYNYQENVIGPMKLFRESMEAFKKEVIRLLTEDFGPLPQQQSSFCNIHLTESENDYEFRVILEPERYCLSFEISLAGLVRIKLMEDYRNKSCEGVWFIANTHWDNHIGITNDDHAFRMDILSMHHAHEAYKLVITIAQYFKKHLAENATAA